MAQNYLEELIQCETCGKSYTANYPVCPHCQAEAKAREISRGKKKGKLSLPAVAMGLALLAGAVFIGYGGAISGGLAVGREYEVVVHEEPLENISSSVTQQRSQISNQTGTFSGLEDSPEDTLSPSETDVPADAPE